MIKHKGFHVLPTEIEAVLKSHPAVTDAAVIGVPDTVAGEVPRAFIVRKLCSKVDAQEVVKFVRERVSDEQRLRGWVKFIDKIPRHANGEILREVLTERARSERLNARL